MRQPTPGRWIGAAGFIALLFAGCGSSEDAVDGGADTVAVVDDAPTEEVEDTAVDTTDAPADEPTDDRAFDMRDPAEPIAADATYDPDATPLMDAGQPFEPGTYRNGAFGTMISFTTTEALHTQPNGDGMFVITDIASRAPDDRDLVFIRVGAFSEPTAPNAPIEEQTLWPNDDFLGWLDNLHDDVIATEPVETTVNGMTAIRVDLSISEDTECGFIPGECVGLLVNNHQNIKGLNKGASYRVWIVEQGDEDPLAIVDGIARDEDAAWYKRSDAIMDTIAFGDIAPNPAQTLVPGPNQLNALGGVEVDLPDNVDELTNGRPRLLNRWTGRDFAFIPITESPGAIYFADRPHDFDGNPLDSTDEVVDELTAAGVELTELDPITIDGIDTRVFDVSSTDVRAIVLRFSPLDTTRPFFGWDAPAAGKLWLIDHPDRGLMTISSHAFENVEKMLPLVNELGEAIVGSLRFVEPG